MLFRSRRTNNGLNVFKHYIPVQWRTGRNFLNPLYDDRKASCNVYLDRRSQIYRLKDFGNDEYSGDCFFYVGKLKGLDCNNGVDFVEILKTINREMNLGLEDEHIEHIKQTSPIPVTPIQEPRTNKPFNIVQHKFSKAELDFWGQSGISLDILNTYRVISLREFRSENKDGKPFSCTSTAIEPIFEIGRAHV